MAFNLQPSKKSQVGLVGLAVMGQNLAFNMLDHGYSVSVYNRTAAKTEELVKEHGQMYSGLCGFSDVADFIHSLETPRKIIMMVKAGDGVDDTIEKLLPFLNEGDILIDGGNSYFEDTLRREKELLVKKIHFVGCGISGGEEGARHGPSMMPGGSDHAKKHLLSVFQAIAARDFANGPCCEWIGPDGSGHFVKMVHNGIEYGDMQLICETYDVMRSALKAGTGACQKLFASWCKGPLESYLIEITSAILKRNDEDGLPLVDKILDVAGQKGTGRWTVEQALNVGVPLTLISEAVFARQLSSKTTLRAAIQQAYGPAIRGISSKDSISEWGDDLAAALYAAKIISYAQGFYLMKEVSLARSWNLHLSEIARIWSGGCIIRSRFLKDIYAAYGNEKSAPIDLLTADFVVKTLGKLLFSLRKVVALAATHGVPVPTLASALSYFDSLNAERLPANLLQAQRDYFGAHTYQRIDRPKGEFFHTDWAGTGGKVSSTIYNA